MLDDNAFLRRLPMTFDGSQAVWLEALVHSADAIQVSIQRMRAIAKQHGEQICTAGRQTHGEMFIHAWNVVDCVHVIRQIIMAFDRELEAYSDFLEKYDCARTLRNRMDHLTANASNVSKAKGRPPVFGTIGYVWIPADNIVKKDGAARFTGGYTIMLSAGLFSPGKIATAVNPADIQICDSIAGLRLEAFGHFIPLEEAEKDVDSVVNSLNASIEAQFLEQALNLSQQHGIPIKKLTENAPGGFSFAIKFYCK